MENVNEKKTTTYSARMSEELKTKLTETLAMSGYSASDFFSKMLNHFQVAENLKPRRKELEEVEKALIIINRAVEGLVVAVDAVEQEKMEQSSAYANEASLIAEDMADAHARIVELEELLSAATEQYNLKVVEIGQLNDKLGIAIEEVKESKASIADMDIVIKNYERKLTENEKEIKRLSSMESMVEDVRQDAKDAKDALKVAVVNTEKMAVVNAEITTKLKDAEKALEQADIQQQKAILEVEKKAFEQRQADLVELNELRKAITNINQEKVNTPKPSKPVKPAPEV